MRAIMRARVWLLAALLLVVLGQPVLAQGNTGSGQVVFGQDFVLPSGERLNGDLVVFGGDVTIETGSSVRGDVAAFGGSAFVDGQVDGNVFAFGGDLRLGESAVVSGDVAASGDVITTPGAVVNGNTILNMRPGVNLSLPGVRTPSRVSVWGPGWPWNSGLGHWIAGTFRWFFDLLVMVALGILAVLVFPRPTRRVGDAVVGYPLQSIGVGLLTGLAAVLLVPLMVLICIGIPVAVLVAIGMVLAVVLGWIAAGLMLGERLLDALHQTQRQPVLDVTVGLVLLGILAAMPCLGAVVSLAVGVWGLGAVVLTVFGSRAYSSGGPALVAPAADTGPTAPAEPADVGPEPEPEVEAEEPIVDDEPLEPLPPLPPPGEPSEEE